MYQHHSPLRQWGRALLTNARAEGHDAFPPAHVEGLLEPLPPFVVGSPEPMAPDVLVGRKLGQSSLEFPPIQVQGVVVNVLASLFKGLEEEVDLAQVAATSASGSVPATAAGWSRTYPLPSSITIAPAGTFSAMLDAESRKTLISSLVK